MDEWEDIGARLGERPEGSGRGRKKKGARNLRYQSHMVLLLSGNLSALSPNQGFYGKFRLLGLGRPPSAVPLPPLLIRLLV